MMHVSATELAALFVAVRDANAHLDGKWLTALAALPHGYRSKLPTGGDPTQTLWRQLEALNAQSRLPNGDIPIVVVLGKLRLQATNLVLSGTVAQTLATIEGHSGVGRGEGPPIAYDPHTPEAYTGVADEILPFDFLAKGHLVGRSVARVTVPRFEKGMAVVDRHGEQWQHKGTGWLISPTLLITNYHVICVRERHEDDPSPDDLRTQLANATVEFDYDREDARATRVSVAGPVAVGRRIGASDYAMLRLVSSAPLPGPLRLRRALPKIPAGGYPVNIIQHPQGWSKRIAIRSNLMKSATAEKLEYFGDTLGGSSGSPLCNDGWEVVGLHRASGPATNVTVNGQPAAAYNIGIPIAAILNDLEASSKQVYEEVRPSIV